MTPADLRALSYNFRTISRDFANGQIVTPQSMSDVWSALEGMATQMAALTDRILVQENRRVGRPPNSVREAQNAGA